MHVYPTAGSDNSLARRATGDYARGLSGKQNAPRRRQRMRTHNPGRPRRLQSTNRSKRGVQRHRMLRLEPLEDRRLLAVLDLSIRFLQDIPQSDGSFRPGAELSSSTVRVEDPSAFFPYSFWVEVQVRDARTPPDTGVISLPLNVIWEPGDPQTPADAVQYSGELPVAGPNPTSFSVQQDNLLLTPDFPLQRFVDNLGLDGEFLNLRGAALPNAGTGAAIGAGEFEPFSQMRFTVNEFGRTCFRSELAGSMSFADAAVLEEVNSEGACIEFLPTGISLSGFVYADVDKDGQRDVSNTGGSCRTGFAQRGDSVDSRWPGRADRFHRPRWLVSL